MCGNWSLFVKRKRPYGLEERVYFIFFSYSYQLKVIYTCLDTISGTWQSLVLTSDCES